MPTGKNLGNQTLKTSLAFTLWIGYGLILGLMVPFADLSLLAHETDSAVVQPAFLKDDHREDIMSADELPEFAIWRIQEVEATSKGVFHIAWSPNGQSIAIQNRGNVLTVFDVSSRTKLFSTLHHESNWIESIDYSPDSKHLVTAAGSGETVKVIDATNGELILEIEITAMEAYFSSCGQFISVAGRDIIERYSFPDGKLVQEIPWRTEQEAVIGMSKESELLVTYRAVGRQNYLSEILIPASQTRIPMPGANTIPNHVTISHCQQRIALDYPGENRVFFWEIHDGQAVRYLLREHQQPIQALAISACGRLLASADSGGNIVVWDLILRQPIMRLVDPSQDCRHLAFSYDGQFLLTGSASPQNQSATIWDLRSGLFGDVGEDFPEFDQLWEKLGSSHVKNSLAAAAQLVRQFPEYAKDLRFQIDTVLGQSISGDVSQWIEQLNHHRFEVRETASQRLANRLLELRPLLENHLQEEHNPEIKYRIGKILRQGKRNPKVSLADARRWQRLIFALEQIQSSEATEILTMISVRHEHSRIRDDASNSLQRLQLR